MDQELFNPQSSSVSSSRIIYTPSTFARTSLLHLQEVGSLQAVHPHVSKRSNLVSFLCFIVLSGEGELRYEGEEFKLHRAGVDVLHNLPFCEGNVSETCKSEYH